jgi:TRAP-type C4-dicarboxylate transport system substrate-binding protein
MKKIYSVLVVFLLLNAAAAPLFAQKKVIIKLASLAPENTDWGRALNRMSREWYVATNGEVELVVYHNGSVGHGNEGNVLKLLKQGGIQAAVFTSIGLGLIAPEVMTLSTPFLIRNDAELDRVLDAVKPDLEAKINQKGYFTIAWAKSGWVKIFARSPVATPADLKRQKLGTSDDTQEINQAFKAMGYQLVPVDFNSVQVSLASGMIDAIYQSSVSVGAYQLFGITKNMTSMNIAPFMGGVVMTQKAWRSIPDQYKPALLAINKQIEREIGDAITRLEDAATKTMLNYGLKLVAVSPEQEQLWYSDVDKAIPGLLDRKVFDRTLYQKISALLQDSRKK